MDTASKAWVYLGKDELVETNVKSDSAALIPDKKESLKPIAEAVKPTKPIKAKDLAYTFQVKVDANDFPEIAVASTRFAYSTISTTTTSTIAITIVAAAMVITSLLAVGSVHKNYICLISNIIRTCWRG